MQEIIQILLMNCIVDCPNLLVKIKFLRKPMKFESRTASA